MRPDYYTYRDLQKIKLPFLRLHISPGKLRFIFGLFLKFSAEQEETGTIAINVTYKYTSVIQLVCK